jgi:multiple sugar transport system substrate-binding protein
MSEEQKDGIVTRREVLKMAGVAGVGLLASACVAQQPLVVEKVVTVEVAKEGEAPEAEQVAESPGMASATVEGALWILEQKDFHPDYNEYIRHEITVYAAEHDWPLDISYIAGFASGTGEVEKIAAAVQAGNPPDLVLHTFSVPQLRNLYVLQPVTDVVQKVEEVYGAAAPFLHQTMFLDEQWWAVPYHQRAGGGYYRRDVFDAAGIDVQAIRQYPDLAEACLAATDPDNGMYTWGITVNRSGDGNSLINRVKTGWGASWQDETGQYITTNSPEMIEAMNFIKDIYTNEKWVPMLPPGVLAWNDISNNEAFLGGVIGYTQNAGTMYAKAVIDKNPVAELINYHKQCGGPVNQEFEVIGGKNWYVLRGAKNTQASKQLILEFTANLERMNTMLASSPAYAVPAYTNLWEMSEFVANFEPAYQIKSAALDASGINATEWPGPPSAALVAIDEGGIWNDMVNAILTGTAVEDAVKEAHDRMVLVFQEFGLPGEKT